MNTSARHVIFGTGAIGLATLDALRGRGETVRMVNRSGSARVPDDVEVIGGNAADPGFCAEVSRGASVVRCGPVLRRRTARIRASTSSRLNGLVT